MRLVAKESFCLFLVRLNRWENIGELMDVRSLGCLKLILGGLSPKNGGFVFFCCGVACN